PGPWVRLVVSDTGVGMTPAVQSRIFEPFFTTKEPGKGTGLGLSTVYGIILQSHGFITFHSELGKGTRFEIYLPSVAADGRRRGEKPAAVKTSQAGDETVLVVEDNSAVRNLVVNVLRANGYNVLTAENGREAIQLAAARPDRIDLLLTDVIMPEMGGKELVERLLQDRPTLKVLYMTGYFGDAAGMHGATDGGGALLRKPFTPAVLCQKVREILDR
ncbi:MAG: response regulator, partial [Acidobacteria bacterium]